MFTPSQVSAMLEIPASSLRRYAVQFAPFLSRAGNQSRRRAYTQNDVLVFKRIRELTGQGVPLEEVASRLQIVKNEPPEKNALALVPEIAAEFQRLASQVARLPELENQIAALAEIIEGERAARIALENELREYKNQTWFKRVFRR